MEDNPVKIIAQLARYDNHSLAHDPSARRAALALSKKLSLCLEDPETLAMGTAMAPMSNLAVRIAIDLDLFSLLVAQSHPVSSSFIAASTHSDPTLVHRILRACSSIHLVQQESADDDNDNDHADSWSANAVTREMARDPMPAWHRMYWDLLLTSAMAAPSFLRDRKHQAHDDPARGILQRAFHAADGTAPYDVLQSMPALHRDFNDAMAVNTGQPAPWFRLFPAEQHLLADLSSSSSSSSPASALLVDVGGGKGHDLQAFYEAFPDSGRAGALVLQDLPPVIDSIEPGTLDPALVTQKHDIFTRQPVRGARAYFLRRVLHQWPDKYCLRILNELRNAMRPAYSRLLIYEAILPDAGAARALCELDLCVMSFSGGMERSKSQWVALLSKAGFDVVKFWQTNPNADGIVEAVVSPA
ncbi:Sterigmatocystin 8-O-methyltransferase [Beauveria bassiana D1-5]|uniref:Sterigmatocystin 8-O-methyltransferase n=1 Tax=Beauveria bassiana D1-5 TaxID=1245745 RepID=A0A0A2VWU4_BEABA|nr:Sterigmatocystin 8-O-methyltransferase [Beauveria bassiana D1-5]